MQCPHARRVPTCPDRLFPSDKWETIRISPGQGVASPWVRAQRFFGGDGLQALLRPTWTTTAAMRLAVPMLMGCALASLAVGCAGGGDSRPTPVATDASSKTAPESAARLSAAPAEAPKQQQARRRHAKPRSDAATA